MNNCQDITKLLSEAQDRTLSWIERIKIRLHLFICDGCTNFNHNLQDMRQLLDRYFSGK
ncbi:MAG: hypothetical protein B7Z60_07915 [Ferrovum sp. 37-45-19]|uniref:zf-HC2 domain-containing protein n=1 Tax=Ferrovum sp. JA12 TaxID=1356299 RepID=UPI0009E90C67|nr:MAG: hypothetical protein B7Z65_07630 [Ferrovum sp. 21-44-67]OYV93701.1 MAG: hypothetical protein B7Z60_07915 [Ferrovum sp. 37-45-19]OZB31678.1 MAG: hypothetical protein B7X47_09180 [Ferrovum sp. 34-44-207]